MINPSRKLEASNWIKWAFSDTRYLLEQRNSWIDDWLGTLTAKKILIKIETIKWCTWLFEMIKWCTWLFEIIFSATKKSLIECYINHLLINYLDWLIDLLGLLGCVVSTTVGCFSTTVILLMVTSYGQCVTAKYSYDKLANWPCLWLPLSFFFWQ